MDILRRNLAPISDRAWDEIDELARTYLRNSLSARFMVDVSVSGSWDRQVLTGGRLKDIKEKGKVSYGLYDVKPLLELRIPFDLDVWEMDNAVRGSRDLDLDPVEEAAEALAGFEDRALFEGLKDAGITGLFEEAANRGKIEFPGEHGKIAGAVSAGLAELIKNGIEGPCNLAVPMEVWQNIKSFAGGMPLEQHLEKLLGGAIIPSRHLQKPLLLSARGGDFEMSIGQDISIGYSSHSTRTVSLYFTESFTFQVFEPRAIVVYK